MSLESKLDKEDYSAIKDYFSFCRDACTCDTDMTLVNSLDEFLSNLGFKLYLDCELEDEGFLIPIWEYFYENGDYMNVCIIHGDDKWVVNFDSHEHSQNRYSEGYEVVRDFKHIKDIIDFIRE